MHIIRQYEFGPADRLVYEEAADLEPAEGEVRVAVEAAGIHLIDTMIRNGATTSGPPPSLPMIPGREVAGIVDQVGDDVDQEWLGRKVVAHLGSANGGYASQAVAPIASLHRMNGSITYAEAVTMVGTGRTALGIIEIADLRPSDVVLITAAAGGMGSLFIQECRHLGATSIALAGGPDKVNLARELGASMAVDYRREDWPEQVRESTVSHPPTVVLDGVGGTTGRSAMELLGVHGRMVIFGQASGSTTEISTGDLFRLGITATVALPRLLHLQGGFPRLAGDALAAAAEGRLRPLVGQTFPLSRAADAHRAIENRTTVGKTVLAPG